MKLTLSYIPNMNQFFRTVNNCIGLVFIELEDQSFLNLKGKVKVDFIRRVWDNIQKDFV